MVDIKSTIENYNAAIMGGDNHAAIKNILPLCEHSNEQIAAHALHLAGIALLRAGDPDGAMEYLNRALKKKGDDEKLYELIWLIFFQREQHDAARKLLETGLDRCDRPSRLLAHLASLETRAGNYWKAEALLNESIEKEQECAVAWINLGNLNEVIGQVRKAMSCFQKATTIDPRNTIAISDFLFCMNYLQLDKNTVIQAHRLYTQPISPFKVKQRSGKQSAEKIRVGYLSSDFKHHAVAFFLLPLLAAHDKSRFEIFCYVDNSSRDQVTDSLQGYSDCWRMINSLSDEDVADVIVNDEIDILVDLSGHAPGRRLRLLKSKPAPIQVSYLGYPNTLGFSEIDGRFVDRVTDPVEADDHQFPEKLLRLESPFLCFSPPGELPPVNALPADRNGFLTFGSFNRLSKISEETLRLWVRLLSAIPESRLLLKTRALADERVANMILDRFQEAGLPSDRIVIQGWSETHFQYLESMGQMDIALDTTPYNGTTTTCNALIMGVPVLTLRGDCHAARVSASLLESVSMSDFVAENDSQYVDIGRRLSADISELRKIRASLRQKLFDSPLLDGRRLAREIEHAYQSLVKQNS
jgi:protein O-GlcNAc transferase